jgi:sulfur carrier protein ThiS adenylyltransferase
LKPEELRKILKTKTVGIAGCGGLGSIAATALARMGVGNFVLADFDLVQEKHLHRQYFYPEQEGFLKVYALKENLEHINPDVIVSPFDIRLCPSDIYELFRDCEVIIEGFDAAKMKQTIIETVLNDMPNTTVIVGNGLAGLDQINDICEQQFGNLIVCGDNQTQISEDLFPFGTKVAIVANMQANAAVRVLANKK